MVGWLKETTVYITDEVGLRLIDGCEGITIVDGAGFPGETLPPKEIEMLFSCLVDFMEAYNKNCKNSDSVK